MGNAAMMLKTRDRAAQTPQGIDVGKLGGDRHGERGVCRAAIESSAGQTRRTPVRRCVTGSIDRCYKPLLLARLRRSAA